MNSLIQASRIVLSKYVTFTGRASRSEFWWWFLALALVMLVTRLIDGAVIAPMLGFLAFQEEAGQPLSMLVALGALLPNIAVGIRRLHDTGRVGWWLLIGLIPIIGGLVLLYFYVQPSEEGENRFGAPEPFSSG